MANIKISELNALSKKAYDDIVPIVDVSANETKKISIEELVNNDVSLLAVTDTAPSECSTGDMYYNTTTNKIYTATGTDTWGTTGEDPKTGIMYIVYSKKSTYSYDGTELVSVGGGSGAYIGTTEPPADDNSNLWINPDEVTNTQQQEELYSTSEIIVGKWIDGKNLYRIVVPTTTPSVENDTIYDYTNLNIETLTKIEGIITANYDIINANYYASNSNYSLIFLSPSIKKVSMIVKDANMRNKGMTLILEYTKSTD